MFLQSVLQAAQDIRPDNEHHLALGIKLYAVTYILLGLLQELRGKQDFMTQEGMVVFGFVGKAHTVEDMRKNLFEAQAPGAYEGPGGLDMILRSAQPVQELFRQFNNLFIQSGLR